MNSVLRREFVGDRIELFLDGEGANESGTQFPAGQAQSDNSGGLPDLLYRLEGRSGRSAKVGSHLLPAHCPLEVMVSLVPDSLTLPEPVINRRDVGGVS